MKIASDGNKTNMLRPRPRSRL